MGDREEHVRRWIVKAEHDLRTADTMIRVDDPTTDTVCFHAQQCVEKCLKAYLCLKDRDIPRIHDLVRLLEICLEYDPDFEALRVTAQELADYAVEARYPDDGRDIPVGEAGEAVDKAKRAMSFVRGRLDSADKERS